MGGTDEATNLVELTIDEHAEAHRKLYEEHGKWQDYIAWKSLAGIIHTSEVHSETTKAGMKEWWNNLSEEEKEDYKKRCSKRPEGFVYHSGWTYTHSDEAKEEIRQFQKSFQKTNEHKKNISKSRKGKALAEKNAMANIDNRKKLSKSCIGRKKMVRPDGTWYWGRP
jgi:hypothetical protein